MLAHYWDDSDTSSTASIFQKEKEHMYMNAETQHTCNNPHIAQRQNAYAHTYTHTNAHKFTHMHIHKFTHIHTHKHVYNIQILTYTHAHAHRCTQLHTRTHTHAHTRV